MKRNLGHNGDGHHQGTKQVYIVETQFYQIIIAGQSQIFMVIFNL